jgi:hypothetical protein
MSKKTKLLAAGVLGALALAALPTFASAGEYEMHCPKVPCVGSINGTQAQHMIEFEDDGNFRFSMTAIEGTITVNSSTTTTATVELTITGLQEKVTGFSWTCSNTGKSGEVKTGPISLHFVNLTHGGTNPGVLLTNINTTFGCPDIFSTRTVTGNLIGTLSEANCNIAAATSTVTFNSVGGPPRAQEFEQVTGAGPIYALTSGNHTFGGADTTASSLTAHLGIAWEAGNKPTLTC